MLPGGVRGRQILFLALALWLAGGCGAAPPAGDDRSLISISCEWSAYPLVAGWVDAYSQQHPEITFDLSAGGVCKGACDITVGAADIGLVAGPYMDSAAADQLFSLPAAKDAAVLAVNCRNPVLAELNANGFSRAALRAIFLDADLTSWESLSAGMYADVPIHVYTRSDTCSTAEAWAAFLGGSQLELNGCGIYGDSGLLEAIASDPPGIGYVTPDAIHEMEGGLPYAGVQAALLDMDADGQVDPQERLEEELEIERAVRQGDFSAPPAWDLYLVCAGKPTGPLARFIRWILTEGQPGAAASGYVALSEAQQAYGLMRLGR